MKRDIRELFKNEEVEVKYDLPQNHRDDFLEKLKSIQSNKSKQSKYLFLKIAAVLIVAIAISFTVFNSENIESPSPIIAQIEAVEAEYLENINAEWQNFITVAKDENLVRRYKEKLTDLDNNYQEISRAFKNDSNNILVIESLVENLQTRLQLLKDIQVHINILNQKTEQNENTI